MDAVSTPAPVESFDLLGDGQAGTPPAPSAQPSPAPVAPVAQPAVQTGAQPVQDPAKPAAQPEAPKAPDGYVPHAVVGELRNELRTERARTEQMQAALLQLLQQSQQMFGAMQAAPVATPQTQPPPPIPDPVLDPQGFQRYLADQVASAETKAAAKAKAEFEAYQKQITEHLQAQQAAVTQQRLAASYEAAKAQHNPTDIQTAADQAKQAGLLPQFLGQPDPYRALMTWYRQMQVISTVGGDLQAYNQRVLSEAMTKPEFAAQVAQVLRNGTPHPKTPPSLAGVPQATGAQPGAAAPFPDFVRDFLATAPPQRR
jgi:hypothetical protein